MTDPVAADAVGLLRERVHAVSVELRLPEPVRSGAWLVWPTLRASSCTIKTAGTFFYADAVRRALSRQGPFVMAELWIEQTGQYAGAVRVSVDGETLGAIPHGLADEFRDVVEQLHQGGLAATCRAELEGGPVGSDGYVDVWLCAKPEPRPDDEPFLPPLHWRDVTLDDGYAEALDESLNSRAKSKSVTRYGELIPVAGGGWRLRLDGKAIGSLDAGPYGRLAEAREAGFPLTCHISIARKPERPLRVGVGLPVD